MALEAARQVVCSDTAIRRSLLKQAQSCCDPSGKTFPQGCIRQQRQQRRRQPHGQLGGLPRIGSSCFKGVEQGQVALDQGLKKPVLFKGVSFRCPDIGKVGVKNKSKCPVGHGPFQSVV